MIKHFLGSIILAFLSISTVTGQSNALDLSGKWNFQIDREDTGVKEQWFRKILEDHINLPGSMPEKLKGDEVTVHTHGQEVYTTVPTILILIWRNTEWKGK